MPCPFCGRVCNNLPNLRSHISGCKTQQFLARTNDLPLPLVTHNKKEKGSSHDPSQERNAEFQRQITKYVVKIDKLFQTLMCLLQMNKLEKSASTILLKKGFFSDSVISLYYICFAFKCYHLFFAIRYPSHGIKIPINKNNISSIMSINLNLLVSIKLLR